MLSNKHTNSREQRSTLLGLFSKVAWKLSVGEIGLKECFMGDLRDVTAVFAARWGRTHKTRQDEEIYYYISLMRESGIINVFLCRFLNKTHSLRSGFCECLGPWSCGSCDYAACSSTREPTYKPLAPPILWGRRKSPRPPSRISSASRKGRGKTDSELIFVSVWSRHYSGFCTRLDFGYEACVSNVLWNCWHVRLLVDQSIGLISFGRLGTTNVALFHHRHRKARADTDVLRRSGIRKSISEPLGCNA